MRRASSCAPATASCDFKVSRLKSMSAPRCRVRARPVEDDFPLVRLVHACDLRPELPLEAVHTRLHPPELVLEAKHVLDAGQVEAELRCQPLDQAQPLDVRIR